MPQNNASKPIGAAVKKAAMATVRRKIREKSIAVLNKGSAWAVVLAFSCMVVAPLPFGAAAGLQQAIGALGAALGGGRQFWVHVGCQDMTPFASVCALGAAFALIRFCRGPRATSFKERRLRFSLDQFPMLAHEHELGKIARGEKKWSVKDVGASLKVLPGQILRSLEYLGLSAAAVFALVFAVFTAPVWIWIPLAMIAIEEFKAFKANGGTLRATWARAIEKLAEQSGETLAAEEQKELSGAAGLAAEGRDGQKSGDRKTIRRA